MWQPTTMTNDITQDLQKKHLNNGITTIDNSSGLESAQHQRSLIEVCWKKRRRSMISAIPSTGELLHTLTSPTGELLHTLTSPSGVPGGEASDNSNSKVETWSELVSECRHKNKFYQRNFTKNATTVLVCGIHTNVHTNIHTDDAFTPFFSSPLLGNLYACRQACAVCLRFSQIWTSDLAVHVALYLGILFWGNPKLITI